MDEIGQRLQETSAKCVTCYEAWIKDKKNSASIEALQDSVHELRRVASRLEIELAVNERDESVQRPMPIPPHRDANRRAQSADDNAGNRSHDNDREPPPSGGPHIEQKGQRRRRPMPPRRAES